MASEIQQLRDELNGFLRYLPQFIRNPVQSIQRPPTLSWYSSALVLLGLAMISGTIGGLLSLSFWNFLLGLFVFPITSFLQIAFVGFFIHVFFTVVYNRELDREKLFALVVLANIPYFVVHMIAVVVPPVDLVGFGASCLLLIVGLNQNFSIERKQLYRLIGGIYAVFFLVWAFSQFRSLQRGSDAERVTVPKNLDTLERELQDSN